jgi:hypothetical protein
MVRLFRFEMPAWRGLPFFGRDGHGSDVMRRFTTSDSARAMARFCGPLNKLHSCLHSIGNFSRIICHVAGYFVGQNLS